MNIIQLEADLIRDEGLKLQAYDCPAGKRTIGSGRNLDDLGLSPDELAAIGATLDDVKSGKVTITRAAALMILANDIARCRGELDRNVPWWRDMPEEAQRGLCNMLYNIGWTRLSGFKKMLAALKEGRYAEAADEALKSKWATQVGPRAVRISQLFQSAQGHPFA